MSGGFVGVDVFFVISGYLITGIIYEQLLERRFSFVAFYSRRFRRILPALAVVLGVSLAAGYWVFAPDDYAAAARSATSASAGLANFFFYRNTGYFDGAAELMPLVHTWSLGVEEQFYVVWPALLWLAVLLTGGRRGPLSVMTLLMATASLGVSIYQVEHNAKAAFFLPLGRGWELALGALLVFLPPPNWQRWAAELASAVALAAILGSVFLLRGSTPFPGVSALPATLGTALLISATRDATRFRTWLSASPIVLIGRTSYSLYLWHWPIIVIWRHYLNGAALPAADAVWLVGLSMAVALISWRVIEQPFRAVRASNAATLGGGIAAMVMVALCGVAIQRAQGFPQRFAAAARPLLDRDVMWQWSCPQEVTLPIGPRTCVVGAPWESAGARGILWGDSHAEHFAPLFDGVARRRNVALALVRSCPPIFTADGVNRRLDDSPAPQYNRECGESRDAVLRYLTSAPDVDLVFVASNWSYLPRQSYTNGRQPSAPGIQLFQEGVNEFLSAVTATGHHVVLLGDMPHVGFDPIPCVLARESGLWRRACREDTSTIAMNGYRARQTETDTVLRMAAEKWRVDLLIPADRLCSAADGCPTSVNGEFVYRDEHHLRRNLQPATQSILADRLGLSAFLPPDQPHDMTAGSHGNGGR